MNENRIFSEVYGVLIALGNQFISCIPYNLIQTIMNSRHKNYVCKYDINKPLNEQKISKGALNIIAKLHLDYWCNSHKERKELYAILQENEKKANDQLLKNMFKKL